MRFEDMAINRTDIDQSLLNIDERRRTSLFAWNGQFSPQFVEAMLDKYTKPGWITYDPFAGSGTVVDESIRMGLGAVATELNPAAYHMARIRQLSALEKDERRELCFSISKELEDLSEENLAEELEALYKGASGDKKDTIALLVILCDFYKNAPSKLLVMSKWGELSERILDFVQAKGRVQVERADARAVPFPTDCADLVLTSPPYINVMNYHQQYRRSVEMLGYEVLKIAKSEFGSNRMNRGNRFLTVIEYAVDMGLSLKETSRVLKEGHRLVMVVGKESCVLGHPFCNSEIVWRVASEVLGMQPMLRQQREFKNKYGKMITEDILHFENSDCQNIDDADITRLSQEIARSSLRVARETVESTDDRNKLLDEAIEGFRKVGKC